jgi:hypothetical protein
MKSTALKATTLQLAALFLISCASITPGNDPVVVNAERITALGADTFDTFLHFEADNSGALKTVSPDIHKFAEALRRNGQTWLLTARSLTKAYKLNKTPENKTSLQTALAVISEAVAQANNYVARAANKTP